MKKKRSISLKTRDSLVGTLFMSPWLIGLLVFTLIPFIYSVWAEPLLGGIRAGRHGRPPSSAAAGIRKSSRRTPIFCRR